MFKPTLVNASWIAALAGVLSIAALRVDAQTPAASDVQRPASPAGVLSLGEIESRLTAQGIVIREIELRDLVVEVEGRDAKGRKLELLVDRRSGEILSQKEDR
jgi:multidrug efflux pump subunit AcrA (membrane-fusion protein)